MQLPWSLQKALKKKLISKNRDLRILEALELKLNQKTLYIFLTKSPEVKKKHEIMKEEAQKRLFGEVHAFK